MLNDGSRQVQSMRDVDPLALKPPSELELWLGAQIEFERQSHAARENGRAHWESSGGWPFCAGGLVTPFPSGEASVRFVTAPKWPLGSMRADPRVCRCKPLKLLCRGIPPGPTTQSRTNRDFPVLYEKPRIGGDSCAHFVSAGCRLDFRGRFGAFVSALQNRVSARQRPMRFTDSMSTVPGAMLLCASLPYGRKGALWTA
jgi:hypothetical protein